MSIGSEVAHRSGRSNYKQQVRRSRFMSHGFCDTGKLHCDCYRKYSTTGVIYLGEGPQTYYTSERKMHFEVRDY